MNINRRSLVSGLALSALGSSAYAAIRTSDASRAQSSAMRELSRYVEQNRTDWGLPGMTVCVVDRTGFTGFITSGWANVETRTPVGPDHLFEVGSISKMITALSIASLQQEGKLSTQAKYSTLMPDVAIRDGADITLQHLLDHTAGLPDDAPVTGELGLWSGFAPSAHWSYSNTGYELIGMIAARADRRSVETLLQERVLRPLGMSQSVSGLHMGDRARFATGYIPAYLDRPTMRRPLLIPAPWQDFGNAAGCVGATSSDMTRLLRFLVELGAGRGAPILSDAAAAQFLANPVEGWDEGQHYGNGVARVEKEGRRYLHHTGGMLAFSSSLHVDVEAGIAAFASTNVSAALSYRPRAVTLYACQLLRAARDGGPAPTPAPTALRVEHPERYAARYTAASGDSFEIAARGDQLELRHNGRTSALQESGDKLACEDAAFARDGLVIDFENEHALRAWSLDKEYLVDPSHGYAPPPSPELLALAGRYDGGDRVLGSYAVVARAGHVYADNTDVLTPLPGGQWRYGDDEWSPERVSFDHVVDGRPMRMLFSGAPLVRTFA